MTREDVTHFFFMMMALVGIMTTFVGFCWILGTSLNFLFYHLRITLI